MDTLPLIKEEKQDDVEEKSSTLCATMPLKNTVDASQAFQQPPQETLQLQPSPLPLLMVDVEGFTLKNDFYVKELAFFNPATSECWVGTFKPPFDKKCLKGSYSATMVAKESHGLKWEDGTYPYSLAFTLISHYGSNYRLFAKGRDKCLWFQQFTTSTVSDLDQLGCPSFQELDLGCRCPYHNTMNNSCALDKSVRLGRYYVNIFIMKPVNI